MPDPLDIFMVAGEPSGDLSVALVAAELAGRPGLRLRGAAGPAMRAAGVQADFDSDRWGTVGIPQSLLRSPYLAGRKLAVRHLLREQPPAVLLPVDFGAFNVRLIREARREVPGLRVAYYFPPSSWDPRARDRSWLAPLVDVVATPFAHSARLLRASGVPAAWVGHAVLDRLAPVADRPAFRREHGLPEGGPVIGVLPGSRALERHCLGPTLLRTVEWLQARLPEATFLWSVLPGRARDRNDRAAAARPGVQVMTDSALIMQGADVVITAMGSATLEAVATGCPLVAVYRGTGAMWLQWKILGVGTEIYAMPNILLGEKLIPELVEEQATPAGIGAEALSLLQDADRRSQVQSALDRVRAELGTPGASRRTADLVERLARGEHFTADDLAAVERGVTV
jgi:lipid-A-disaccharide synthase